MNAKTDVTPSVDEKKEIDILRARIAELEKGQKSKAPVKDVNAYEQNKIQLDAYIPVMSLIPFRLNLSTKEGGTGDIKKFTKFGEVKNILYKDLVDIIEVHSNFMEAGYFYILDPRVIRQHGLDEIYSKILTKEKIEEILLNNTNPEQCIDLYNSANSEQQKIIVQLLISRIKENPSSVNPYTVDRISSLSDINIRKKAEDEKELQKELIEQNKE